MSKKAVEGEEHKQPRRRPLVEEIEPRILYSADFAPGLVRRRRLTPDAEQRTVDPAGRVHPDLRPGGTDAPARAGAGRDQHARLSEARRRHRQAGRRWARHRGGAAGCEQGRHPADHRHSGRTQGSERGAPDLARRGRAGAAGHHQPELRLAAEERHADQGLGQGAQRRCRPADLRLRRGAAGRRQGAGRCARASPGRTWPPART